MTRSSDTAKARRLMSVLHRLKTEVTDLEFVCLCAIGIMIILFG